MEQIFKHQLAADAHTLQIQIRGDVVGSSVAKVRHAFLELVDRQDIRLAGWRLLKLDLTEVARIDSLGLDLCLTILREVQLRSGSLHVTVSNPDIHRSFVFMGLDQQMKLQLVPPGAATS